MLNAFIFTGEKLNSEIDLIVKLINTTCMICQEIFVVFFVDLVDDTINNKLLAAFYVKTQCP